MNRAFFIVLAVATVIAPLHSFAYTTNMSASVVIGQSDFESGDPDRGGSVSELGLHEPYGIATNGTKLAVADCVNHRVLIYNSIPTTSGAGADVVVGQPDMESNQANQGGSPDANTLRCPENALFAEGKLLIVDGNNRVLIYNSVPTTDNAVADVVIGQPDMQSGDPNQGGSVAANTLWCIDGIAYDEDSGKLLINDNCNNRVLIYNSIPTTDNVNADVVIGQPDMESNDDNQGGAPAANTLMSSVGVQIINSKLFISDDGNNRVLIFNSIPTTDNASADIVIGQPDMESNQANQGDTPGPNTLHEPSGVAFDGENFFITEQGNNRVLIFDGIPTSDNASAVAVIGQPDFESVGINQGGDPADNTLDSPFIGIIALDDKLILGDDRNHRILIYQNEPTDTTPPVRSNAQPSGTLARGTTSTELSLETNETATCKYSTTANTAFASMTNTFEETDSTIHTTTVSGLSDGQTYTYYVRCQDEDFNANGSDTVIRFSVKDRIYQTTGGRVSMVAGPALPDSPNPPCDPTRPPFCLFLKPLEFGVTDPAVKTLQTILNEKISAQLPVTGYFGPLTHAAVIAFQEKNTDTILTPLGLTEGTGRVGRNTLNALNLIVLGQ